MKKFSERSLYRKVISMFLLIFSYTVLIAIVFILPMSIDRGAALASCLSFGATLYAAIVAYLLLDMWKQEHKASYFSDLGKNLINHLKILHGEVLYLSPFQSEIRTFQNSKRADKYNLIEEHKKQIFSKVATINLCLDQLMHEGLFYLKVIENELLKKSLLDFHEQINSLFIEITNKINENGDVPTNEILLFLEGVNANFMKISDDYIGEIINLIKSDSFLENHIK